MGDEDKLALKPTMLSDLIFLFLVTVFIGYIAVSNIYPDYPDFTWKQLSIFLFISLIMFLLGLFINKMRKEDRVRVGLKNSLNPILISRFAIIGKVTSWTGAFFTGMIFSYLAYIIIHKKYYEFFNENLVTVLNFLGAIILLLAGLWLEACCKISKDLDDYDSNLEPI